MLSFGLKAVWFSVSLAGLLSSWTVVPAFARAAEEFCTPVLYCAANTVLQGIFCLGLIWRMDPFRMPHSFCLAQVSLIHASWACISGICTTMTVSTASRVFRESKLLAQLAGYAMFLRIALVAGFPCVVLVAQTVVTNAVDAARPTDGMHCDSSFPSWVRLLGYAGANLLLAVPSFILSCITVIQATRFDPDRPVEDAYIPPSHNDSLTHLPPRRSRRKSYRTAAAPLPTLEHPMSVPSSIDQPLFSSMRTVYAIPSGPDSSSTVGPPGRARVIAGRTRYHLPFDWIQTRYSFDEPQDVYDKDHMSTSEPAQSTDPSPIHFASPSEIASTEGSSSRVTSPALSAEVEKDSIHLNIYAGFSTDGQFMSDRDDIISGPLRWARRSGDSSDVKSDLVFVKYDDDDGEFGAAGMVYEDPALRFQPVPTTRQPNARPSGRHVWPSLAFQILSSTAQILGAISSLIDIATRAPSPTPFGTQHVALLLAAWGPCMVFGAFMPFRRSTCIR